MSYWFEDPSNPFVQMDYTRGGGGHNNDQTRESNDRRSTQYGLTGVPRYASLTSAGKQMSGPGLAFIDGQLGHVGRSARGAGIGRETTADGGTPTSGPGAAGAGDPTVPGAGAKPSFGVGGGAIGGPVSFGPKKGPGRKVKMPDDAKGDEQRQIAFPYGGDEVLIVEPDERFPDVDDWWETRYGEPGEWIGGLVNMGIDASKNAEAFVRSSIMVQPGSIADEGIKRATGVYQTPDDDLPNPMSMRPMSGW